MKTFIDKVFKKKDKDAEQIKENKEILSEQIKTSIKERIDQNRINMEEVEKEIYNKPGHYFADCNCFKCIRWKNQSAK